MYEIHDELDRSMPIYELTFRSIRHNVYNIRLIYPCRRCYFSVPQLLTLIGRRNTKPLNLEENHSNRHMKKLHLKYANNADFIDLQPKKCLPFANFGFGRIIAVMLRFNFSNNSYDFAYRSSNIHQFINKWTINWFR